MNCLSGCVTRYQTNQLITPIDTNSLAPFVKIRFFGGQGVEMTVGNESIKEFDNTAVIKGFSYGTSNGVVCKVEIFDEQGGSFVQFANRLSKCIENASSDYSMLASWGWITSNCDGSSTLISSPEARLLPLNLEVDFSEGRIKYIVTGVDLMQLVFASRAHPILGQSGGGGITLKEALIKLFGDNEPKVRVKFLRKNPDNTIADKEWDFDNAVRNSWPSDGQNKLSTARKWIRPFLTDNKKGCFATWSNVGVDAAEPTIIFWEDVIPACNETVQSDLFSIGTFIVNGGECSSVISFNPNINWAAAFSAFSTGGSSNAPFDGKAIVKNNKQDSNGCINPGNETGLNTPATTSPQSRDAFGPKEAASQGSQNADKNMRANMLYTPGMNAITADLRIQGNPDPKFVDVRLLVGMTASVVVINPFHILGTGNDNCGDWLAYPDCNEVLSNRRWLILGCNHEIKEGSYTTTLNLVIQTPGIHLAGDSTLGGDSGGWRPFAC